VVGPATAPRLLCQVSLLQFPPFQDEFMCKLTSVLPRPPAVVVKIGRHADAQVVEALRGTITVLAVGMRRGIMKES
jgi:hypothetical protein